MNKILKWLKGLFIKQVPTASTAVIPTPTPPVTPVIPKTKNQWVKKSLVYLDKKVGEFMKWLWKNFKTMFIAPTPPPGNNPPTASLETHPVKKKLAYLISLTILAILTLIFYFMWKYGAGNTPKWGAVLMGIEMAYIYFGFGQRKVGKVYAMFLLGAPLGDIKKKGIYWVPLGVIKMDSENGLLQNIELPGDPEKIFRGEGSVPDGMVAPIRTLFGPPNPKDNFPADSPYNRQMTLDIDVVVSRTITSLTKYRKTFGTRENEQQVLVDRIIGVFTAKFAKITPAKAMQSMDKTNKAVRELLQKISNEEFWGIKIVEAYVKPLGFSHALNTAVIDVSISEQRAKGYTAEQTAVIDQTKRFLVETGQIKVDASGKVLELVPDANQKIIAEAIGKLASVTGTLVLNPDQLKNMLNIGSSTGSKMPTLPVTTTTKPKP